MKIWSTKDVITIFGAFSIPFFLLLLVLSQFQLEPAYKILIVDVGMFIFVLAPFAYLLKKKQITWKEFGFDEVKFKWAAFSMLLAFGVILLGGFLSKTLSSALGFVSDGSVSTADIALSDKAWLNFINLKIGIALLVPFAEELLFRGLLFRYIRQEKSFLFAATLSSALFVLAHFSLGSLPFVLLLGFTTAFVYEKTKSMFYPVFIHMAVNSLAASALFYSSL